MNEEIKGLLQALVDGKELQRYHVGNTWDDCTFSEALMVMQSILDSHWNVNNLRIKPDTITINGVEVPAPERGDLSIGTLFYTPRANSLPGFVKCGWDDSPHEELLLKRGQVWLKEDDIKQVVKALGWTE